jgi:hypothetical protein
VTPEQLRDRLDLWVAARAASEALEAVIELEERAAYGPTLRQLFSAELDPRSRQQRNANYDRYRETERQSLEEHAGPRPSVRRHSVYSVRIHDRCPSTCDSVSREGGI